MTDSDLRKFAHDIRGPIHSSKLNLDAARMLASRVSGKDAERLAKHLQIIQSELNKLEEVVAAFGKKLGS
jgi:hypothetical protein